MLRFVEVDSREMSRFKYIIPSVGRQATNCCSECYGKGTF